MAQIFVSYASTDKARVQGLIKALTKHGWSVWWDRTIPPGRTFDEVIEEALDSSQCVIVVWSNAGVRSQWVRTEAEEAARRRVLVPVLIDDVVLPLQFRRIQAARLIDWDGESAHPELDRLVEAVRGLLEAEAKARAGAEAASRTADEARRSAEEGARAQAEARQRAKELAATRRAEGEARRRVEGEARAQEQARRQVEDDARARVLVQRQAEEFEARRRTAEKTRDASQQEHRDAVAQQARHRVEPDLERETRTTIEPESREPRQPLRRSVVGRRAVTAALILVFIIGTWWYVRNHGDETQHPRVVDPRPGVRQPERNKQEVSPGPQPSPPATQPLQLVKAMIAAAAVNGGIDREGDILRAKDQLDAHQRDNPRTRGNRRVARERNNQGLAFLSQQRFPEALQSFREANEADPADVEVMDNLGLALMKVGDLTASENQLLDVLSIAPGRGSAWAVLGQVYAKQGKIQEAVGSLANVFRFSSSQPNTRTFLKQLAAGDPDPRVKDVAARTLGLRLLAAPS